MAASPRAQLLNKGSATGSWVEYRGGPCFLVAYATTWNGATVSLEYKADTDGSVAIACVTASGAAASLTANGMVLVVLPAGQYRAAITGSPTGLTAYLTAGVRDVTQ